MAASSANSVDPTGRFEFTARSPTPTHPVTWAPYFLMSATTDPTGDMKRSALPGGRRRGARASPRSRVPPRTIRPSGPTPRRPTRPSRRAAGLIDAISGPADSLSTCCYWWWWGEWVDSGGAASFGSFERARPRLFRSEPDCSTFVHIPFRFGAITGYRPLLRSGRHLPKVDPGERSEEHSLPPGNRARYRRPRARAVRLWRQTTPKPAETATVPRARSSIDGSSTVYPMSNAAAELLSEQNPNIQVTVGEAGTGGGFERFCAGETDISDASRPIEDDEFAACEEGGVEYTELQVATDALTVVVNKDLAVDCLTTDQLISCGSPGSGQDHQLEPTGPQLPRPGDLAVRARHGLRHLRLLAADGSTTRRAHSRRLRGVRGRQRARPGRRRHRGCDRLLRLHVLRGEHRHAQGGRRSTPATAASSRPPRPHRTATYTPLSRPLFIYVTTTPTTTTRQVAGVRRLLHREPRGDRRGRPVHPAERRAVRRDPVALSTASRADRAAQHLQIEFRPHTVLQARPPGRACRRPHPICPAESRPGRARHQGSCSLAALLSVAITFGIVIALIRPVIDFFREVPFGDFFGTPMGAERRRPRFGVLPLVPRPSDHRDRAARGRTARAGRRDVPVRVRLATDAQESLKPMVELLAGIPSVVYGFFALSFVTPTLLQDILQHRRRLHQRPGRRPGARRDDRPDRRVAVARTRCPPSRWRCGRARWPWVPTGCRRRCGWSSRPPSPASPRRSCSACRGPSARR